MFHELQRRGLDVSYVKNASGTEVDFLAVGAGDETLIQVCAAIDDDETLGHELRGLADAAETWPHARRILLTLEHRVPFAPTPGGETMAAWRFILGSV